MNQLSHIDENGKAKMVDVSNKQPQLRIAVASGHITLENNTVNLIKQNSISKGDVLTVAKIAAIQSAKKTSDIIPLCHSLQLTNIKVDHLFDENGILITSEVRCIGATGCEMEALHAVTVALLTIYDMCKAVDKKMQFNNIHLVSKSKADLV